MTNHPNRSKFPFQVHAGGTGKPCAGFPDDQAAQSYARWLSAQPQFKGYLIDVLARDGIVGQYTNGTPTPEFRGRGDEHYPAGRR